MTGDDWHVIAFSMVWLIFGGLMSLVMLFVPVERLIGVPTRSGRRRVLAVPFSVLLFAVGFAIAGGFEQRRPVLVYVVAGLTALTTALLPAVIGRWRFGRWI